MRRWRRCAERGGGGTRLDSVHRARVDLLPKARAAVRVRRQTLHRPWPTCVLAAAAAALGAALGLVRVRG